jgi:polysaccharide deacetylase 2 family uncharacterized protein YibQ
MTGRLQLVLGILVLVTAGAAAEPHAARVAIIIDDLGYELAAGRRSIDLPGPVACAILPSTPRARRLAQAAHSSGKEVLLHLPLDSGGDDDVLEPGGIRLDMSRKELAATLGAGLDSVPHAVGVNNHRGSMLTRHPGHMHWLMEEIRKRGNLFFIDSYTTHKSVALQLALESGVMAVKRDVFLDPDRSPATVVREFARLKELAKQNGAALGIGHPYPTTLALLETEIPKLPDEGIELIGIAELVSLRNSAAGFSAARTGDEMR